MALLATDATEVIIPASVIVSVAIIIIMSNIWWYSFSSPSCSSHRDVHHLIGSIIFVMACSYCHFLDVGVVDVVVIAMAALLLPA